MATRRPHKKSRLGCRYCKARKVKCDEARPLCGSCQRRRLPCDSGSLEMQLAEHLQPVQIPRLQGKRGQLPNVSSSPSISISISSPSPSPSCMSTASSRDKNTSNYIARSPSPLPQSCYHSPLSYMTTQLDRLMELRLFHHYLVLSSTPFTSHLHSSPKSNMTGQYIWSSWVLELAESTPSLMDALLACAATHLRTVNKNDRRLHHAAHEYMSRAIAGQAELLKDGITGRNAEVVYATSTFIALHENISVNQTRRGIVDDVLPLHWFRPYQGVKTVRLACWPYLQHSNIKAHLEKLPYPDLMPLPESTQPVFAFLLEGLSENDPDMETYEKPVRYLSQIHNSTVSGHILCFAGEVSARFTELLADRDPRTIAIVAYFFMLLRRVENLWWISGTLNKEFKTLMGFLPKEWHSRMQWAISEFEGVGTYSATLLKGDENFLHPLVLPI